jgi:O-antigen ligase
VPGSALLLAGIWCTHSRGGLVGLVVLVGLLARRRLTSFGSALASAGVAILMLAMGYTGGRTGDDRLNIWSDGLGMFKSSPIWGVGYRHYTDLSNKTAHNSFLLCAVELGLIGCFLWVGALLVSLWELRLVADVTAIHDSDEELRAWANAVFLSLLPLPFPGWFLSGNLRHHAVFAPGDVGGHRPSRNRADRHGIAAGRQSLGTQDRDGLCRIHDTGLRNGTIESLLIFHRGQVYR